VTPVDAAAPRSLRLMLRSMPAAAAHAFLYSGLSSLLIAAIGLVTGILAARVLGPVDRGNLATVLFWPALLAPAAALSLGDTLVVSMRRADPGRTAAVARAVARRAFLIGWPIGALTVVLLTARHDGAIVAFTLLVWTVQLWEQCTTQVAGGILRHEHRFLAINLIRLCLPTLYVALALTGVAAGAGLAGFVLAFAASLAITRFIWAQSVRGHFPAADPRPAPADFPPFLARVRALHGVTLASMFSGNIDKIFVVALEGAAEIGTYFVALAVAVPLQTILSVAIQSSALSYLVREGDRRRSLVAARLLRLSWFASIAVSLAVAAISPVVVPIAFGEEFRDAGTLAAELALVFALVPVRTAIIEILKSTGHTDALVGAEAALVGLFAVAYLAASASGADWPVVWGLVAGLAGSAILLATTLSMVMPSVRIRDWLVPTPATLQEFGGIAAGFARRRGGAR
jgi:O-antigen/teichoic acid export membrane protein